LGHTVELSTFQKLSGPSPPTMFAPRVDPKSAELVYNVASPF